MKAPSLPSLATAFLAALLPLTAHAEEKAAAPAAGVAPKQLKALLVIGGCCHDYAKQKDILKAGIEQRANVTVTVCYSDDKGTSGKFPCYVGKDWASGYNVIIHDECTANVKDVPYVENIMNAHKNGTPGVNLHCAMHCYRVSDDYGKPTVEPGSPTAIWFDFTGLQTTGHGAQIPIALNVVDATHPITKGSANWTTIKEELYNNIKLWPTAHALIRGKQAPGDKPGQNDTVVAWTNEYGPKKTRVFSTTLGHNNETVTDDRYLELVCRGMLWACGKLDPDGKPLAGYGPAAGK